MSSLPETVSTADFALLVDLSPRRVQQLIAANTLPKFKHGQLRLVDAVRAFIEWKVQSEVRDCRPAPAAADLEAERTRKLRLENDEAERMLLRTDDALAAIDAIVGPIPAELAAVAPRVTDDPQLRRQIEDEIDAALNDVAARLGRAIAALEKGSDALAEAAEDDPDDLGEDVSELPAKRRTAR